MNFPESPTLNQLYTFASKTWKWNGIGWELVNDLDSVYSPIDHIHSNATTTVAGFMSPSDKMKLDGLSPLSPATDTTLGGIELFSNTVQTVAANAISNTASRTYGIQFNADGQAVVNVPWTDTTYTAMTVAEAEAGTATTLRTMRADYLNTILNNRAASKANISTTISAGNGLIGGGSLAANRTITLGTPSSVTLSSTNIVTLDGHTHAFSPGGTTAQYIRGNGSLATFPAIPTSADYVATSGNQSGLAGNKSWTGSHTFTGGVSLGSTVASSTSNLASHLSIYGDTYGFNVTGNRLNAVIPTGAAFAFVRDGTDVAGISHLGVSSTNFLLQQANGEGIRFWGGNSQYSIYMSAVGDGTWGGRAPQETTSDYNIYFRMTGGTNRGFVFRNNATNVAGIDSTGAGYFTSHVYSQSGSFFDFRGNVRKLPFNTQNANYTFTTDDFNGAVEKTNNSSYTYTLNNIGSQAQAITIVNSGTAGNITIARGSGVALYRNGVNANITVGPGSMVTIYRSATSGRWIA